MMTDNKDHGAFDRLTERIQGDELPPPDKGTKVWIFILGFLFGVMAAWALFEIFVM